MLWLSSLYLSYTLGFALFPRKIKSFPSILQSHRHKHWKTPSPMICAWSLCSLFDKFHSLLHDEGMSLWESEQKKSKLFVLVDLKLRDKRGREEILKYGKWLMQHRRWKVPPLDKSLFKLALYGLFNELHKIVARTCRIILRFFMIGSMSFEREQQFLSRCILRRISNLLVFSFIPVLCIRLLLDII